jgi:hypothetical protein
MDGFIDGTWHSSGNDALRPRDVRACGTYLLAAASLPFLAAYVLILIAIRLFLRSDEVIHLSTTESFLPSLFIRKNGRIHCLAVKVKGKCDGDWKYYYLWMDDKYPSICPVRHLLIYVYVAGIKAGQLFPTKAELADPPEDGNFLTTQCCESFRQWFKRLLVTVLPNRGEFLKVGLHMFRKTGYTFAIWGNGIWPAIKKDARHVSDKDAYLYAGDSYSAKHVQSIFKDPLNAVGEYKPSIIENPGQMAVDCSTSDAVGCSLYQVATEYVASLNVPQAFQCDITTLVKAAHADLGDKDSDKLLGELEDGLSAAQIRQLELYLEVRDQERTAAAVDLEAAALRGATVTSADDPSDEPPSNKRAAEEQQPVEQATKKKAREYGNNSLEARKDIAGLATLEEKVGAFCELAAVCPEVSDLTLPAKTFVTRSLRPVMRCLQIHHKNDRASFVNRWQGQFKMKFSQCCKGSEKKPCGDLS